MTNKTAVSYKNELDERRKLIRERHEKGEDGLIICHELSKIVDEIVINLLVEGDKKFDGAIVALGGYGRGLLNPFSDIDLLFLLNRSGSASAAPTQTLAKLWDLKLKVGHSARSISDTIEMGLKDHTARTAMIESRFLTGDEELFREFQKKYERKVIRNKPNRYISAKIEEMRIRRLAHGQVVRLTEPNLKESRGGLRDFHTAMWVMRSKADVSSLEELAAQGMMDKEDVEPLNRAHSFLLKIRNSLHWRMDGPADTLIQSVQPFIGKSEGFEGSDNEVAAELMRRYYEAACLIERFTGEMVDFAFNYMRKRLWRPIRIDKDGLFTDGKKLHARSFPGDTYYEEPAVLFRIARRLSEENIEPAPNMLRSLNKVSRKAPEKWFKGAKAGRMLMAVLKLRNSARALSVFHQTGLLSRIIPEFDEITNLSQFDMFHRYSVDQHTLFTIQNLENIPQAPVCDRLRSVFRGEPSLETVKLALLLHDLGKRAEDHHTQEDPYARVWAILERLGLEKLTEKIAFLVRRHLLMSETAQRHNFSEPETLKRFCRITGSRKNLEMLYLLTYADISGVGPGVWSDWKDKILLELFESAEQYFIKGDALFMSDEARLDAMVKQIAKIGAASYEESEVQDFLAKAPERYFRNATPETVLADMDLIENLDETPIAFRYAPNPGDETGKITLAASERLGFFSIIAGAMAAKSVNIVEAQIYTFDGRVALDTITVEGANLSIFSDKHSLDRFTKEIIELLDGKKDMKEMVARRTRYLQPKAEDDSSQIEPQAVLLNHLSDDFSVVEIWAPDRVGLLYDITRTLARLKLDIHSAKISNEGRIAIDVFYITSEAGAKIEDDTRAKEITDSLISAIRSPAGID